LDVLSPGCSAPPGALFAVLAPDRPARGKTIFLAYLNDAFTDGAFARFARTFHLCHFRVGFSRRFHVSSPGCSAPPGALSRTSRLQNQNQL
jgi:hypothetical protein